MRAYVARHGHARVPVRHREGNFCLGRWVSRCRRRHRDGELSPERVHALERLPGWTWDPRQARYEEGLRLLRDFARKHGHARVPDRYEQGGFPLGSWVHTRRLDHKQGRLDPAHKAALSALPGWSWRRHEDDFREGLRVLERFMRREGHARVPDRHRESGFPLGAWVRNRRREQKVGQLPRGRARRLARLRGWLWDHWDGQFATGLARLRRFVKRHGHALVPARHVEHGFPLGAWVNNRRRQYRRGELAAERVRALEALRGWRWRLRLAAEARPRKAPRT